MSGRNSNIKMLPPEPARGEASFITVGTLCLWPFKIYIWPALLWRLAYVGKAALERLENGVCYWTFEKENIQLRQPGPSIRRRCKELSEGHGFRRNSPRGGWFFAVERIRHTGGCIRDSERAGLGLKSESAKKIKKALAKFLMSCIIIFRRYSIGNKSQVFTWWFSTIYIFTINM